MPKSNREDVRFGSMPESEAATKNKSMGEPRRVGSFQLPTLGPVPKPPPLTNPLLGYSYRDNETFTYNLEKADAIVDFLTINLAGYNFVFNNGSAVGASTAVYDVNANFWPNVYLYLHEMAQKRDGYRALATTLNTAANVRYRDELLIAMKINIRVMAQLFCASLTCPAAKSMLPAFRDKRSRILRDLEASNRLIYPAEWDKIIDYWSQVYTPYPGGPLVVHFFEMMTLAKNGAVLAPAIGNLTAWAALPDLTSATDVANMLSDIETVQTILENYNINVAATKTDIMNIVSLYAMMGFPTPQTKLPKLVTDPDKFHAQFMRYGFLFNDTKGLGADYHVFWPDVSTSTEQDKLINVDYGPFKPDILDFIGAKGRQGYAYDADDDATLGYAAEANDLTVYGLVSGTNYISASIQAQAPAAKVYTVLYGWETLSRELDYTDATGLQAHIWSIPDMAIHPEAWRVIMSEEAEKAYLHNLGAIVKRPVQIPFDHFGQTYRQWLYDTYKIPYVT